jgi:carboxylate-amine ligase
VHPFFNTVEFRICDVPLTTQETITIAALFQGICAKLYKLRSQNLNFMMYPRMLINENKWRAGRYGIEGSMIDFGKETEVNTRVLIYELLDFIDDVSGPLGIKNAVGNVHKILETGTGADRQIKVFEETENLTTVVDYIHSQFLEGI